MTLDDLIRCALAIPDGVWTGEVAPGYDLAEVGRGEFDYWDVRRIVGSTVRTFAALHRALVDTLELPDDTGANWNALSDSMSDMMWDDGACRIVVIDGAAELLTDEPLEQLGGFLNLMTRAVREMAEPVALGEWWDRDGLTFRCILIETPERIEGLRARIAEVIGTGDRSIVHEV